MIADQRWWELALCAQVDPELWYPGKGGPVAAALRICMRCPARVDCLTETVEIEAGENSEPSGVRGGLTARQRGKLVSARKAQLRAERRAAA